MGNDGHKSEAIEPGAGRVGDRQGERPSLCGHLAGWPLAPGMEGGRRV